MLSENLQRIRKEKKLTKRQLGKNAKIHPNTIKLIEQGHGATLSTLKKLANALNVTVNDLIE